MLNFLWTGLYVGTAIYWVIGGLLCVWALLPIWPRWGDKGLALTCIITCTFCVWFMWVIVYMSQMYPVPGVMPQVLWPENYVCDVYPPPAGDNATECYHNPGP